MIVNGPSQTPQISPIAGSPPPNKPTILVVDDEAPILLLLSTVLKSRYTVLTAKDSAAANEVLQSAKVDLIMCDNDMTTKGEGIAFSRERPQEIPFILMSARLFEDDTAGLPIAIFIRKPFANLLEIPNTIERILNPEK